MSEDWRVPRPQATWPRSEHPPIGTSAREGLVATDDVEGVDTDPHVERVLAGRLDDVLVGANTGGLKSLRRDLLVLVGDEVAAEGEVVDRGLLATEVEDTDLRKGEERGGTYQHAKPRI